MYPHTQMSLSEDNGTKRGTLLSIIVARPQCPGILLASQAKALLSNSSVEAPYPGLKSDTFVEIQLLYFQGCKFSKFPSLALL